MKVDIKDKRILVHFEQGFGDSIMFVRFLDELKSMCKEVSLVVQRPLVSLFEDSKLGVNIYTEEQIPNINFDYYIPMMDLPIVCETKPSTIPKAGGYLKVPKSKINAYKKEYINDNDKIKIGSKTTFTQYCHFNAQENGSTIVVGDGCMFSNNC